MEKVSHKIVSLILVVIITLLLLHYTSIISFSRDILDSLCFTTLSLIIFSATTILCSKSSKLYKFINAIILISIFSGVLLYIIQNKLNYAIYISLLLTLISALMDMFYKKP